MSATTMYRVTVSDTDGIEPGATVTPDPYEIVYRLAGLGVTFEPNEIAEAVRAVTVRYEGFKVARFLIERLG